MAALPVKPGREGRAAEYKEELAKHEKRYEELNHKAGLKRHMEFLQESPLGALVITIFETDDPSKLVRTFGEDDFDKWWVERIHDLHGVDLKGAAFSPPKVTTLLDWQAPGTK
ncbi:MAG: hypothetical protein M3O91_01540 [Chloroflexota bacterium]|nr:hypothetical protein [Chloroflexota bacterium]